MRHTISIDKTDLQHLYVDLDKTTYEIAEMFHCQRRTISRKLKKFSIPIRRHKRKYSSYYEQKLNNKQKELIYGSLLGDGHVAKHHEGVNSCRFVEKHSIKQHEYLLEKVNILRNFISSEVRIIDNSKNKSFSNGLSCEFQTVLHKEFIPFREMFYCYGYKKIPYFELKPFSLAIWYFDDGSIDTSRKNQKFVATFHTEDFDHESIEVCQQMLSDFFGIDSFVVCYKKKYNLIRLNSQSTKKLLDIVRTYPMPSMGYKLANNPVETYS